MFQTRKALMRSVVATTVCLSAFALVSLASEPEAQAQEIQLTGPLAGAPAVREMRQHRNGRFEITPNVSFTLLDEYQRAIIPGLRLEYHFTDWFGLGVWGGYGISGVDDPLGALTTGLTDQLQEKAIDNRNCDGNPSQTECQLTRVNLTRGSLVEDQLGRIQWVVAPELTFVPFRGKLALFGVAFVDTDVSFFLGPAVIGLQEREECGRDGDGAQLTPCADSHQLKDRIWFAPTFGLGLNFYPTEIFGFGGEWRALPFEWNTSGFDKAGGGTDNEFPDNNVNGADREFKFNSMVTINLIFRVPGLSVSP